MVLWAVSDYTCKGTGVQMLTSLCYFEKLMCKHLSVQFTIQTLEPSNPGKTILQDSCFTTRTMQESGHFPSKILAHYKILAGILQAPNVCTRIFKKLTRNLQVFARKRTFCLQESYFVLQDGFAWEGLSNPVYV